MRILDPTYLRYVYDGLQKGSISSENPSVLPVGLVGVYEEVFLISTSLNQRTSLLDFFSVWALLKKEVSAAFVLPLLCGWTEEQVLECIAQYSRWFNSPLSGKYQIYHERLRTFVLQRVSANELRRCNESIIRICHEALAIKSYEEWDVYAIEHLSTHLLTPAMEGFDSVSLKTLAYDTAHWNRQIEISKGYDWTKKMHNEMMLWASKYDDEQVIECALNKVDLYHLEQNDAPRIVELVAQNDIETALSRIESFGGNDKDGLQRKFILYMLCLMELTLLDSRDKSFRRDAIEKILKHLDENLPVDHSLLNWHEFLSDHIVFKIIYAWKRIGIDYIILINRTSDLQLKWLTETNIQDLFQLEILVQSISQLSDSDNRFNRLSNLIDILHSTGKSSWIEKMIPLLDEEALFEKCLINVQYPAFYEGGEQMIISSILRLKNNINKINLLAKYFSSLSLIEKELCSKSILELILNIIPVNKDNEYILFKGYLLMTDISYSVGNKTNALSYFSKAKASLFNIEESKRQEFALNEIIPLICKLDSPAYALALTQQIKNDISYVHALTGIINHYIDLNDFDNAKSIAMDCRSPFLTGFLLNTVTENLLKAGRIDEAVLMTQQKIPLESQPNIQLILVKGLCDLNDYDRALLIVDQIWAKIERDLAYQLLSVQMASLQKIELANAYLKKIQDSGIQADTLFKMYMQCAVSVRTNESGSLWGEMMNQLKSVPTLDKMRLHAKKIIDVLSPENDLNRIQELLYISLNKRTDQNALLPSIESSINSNSDGIKKDIELYKVLQNCIEMNNEEEMVSIGQLFKSNEYKLFSAILIADYYANKNDIYGHISAMSYLSDALDLVEELMMPSGFLIESRFVQLKVAKSMLPVLVKMQYWDDAIGIIEKIELPNDRFDNVLLFISLLIKYDQEDRTDEIIDKLLNDISGIELIKRLEILTELSIILSGQTQGTRGKNLMIEVVDEYKKLVGSEKKHKINLKIISGITIVLGRDFMFEFCEKHFHSSNKDKVVGFLAIDCLKQGDLAGLTRYLALISKKTIYLATITKVVELCQSDNHEAEYRLYMNLSLKIYQELDIQKLSDSILNHLLSIACKANDLMVIDSILLMNKSASEQDKLINTLGEHLGSDIGFCNDDYFKRLVHPTLGLAFRTAFIQGFSTKHINQDLLIRLLRLNSFSAEHLEYLLKYKVSK